MCGVGLRNRSRGQVGNTDISKCRADIIFNSLLIYNDFFSLALILLNMALLVNAMGNPG